ncbi:MAG: VanZ family protein [Anaerolineae bacterium]|nr:MAG: VanZ family protein [Anaerolineae bacterium]
MTSAIYASLKQLCRWPLLYYWLPLVTWMGAIFWFSAQPQPLGYLASWLESLAGIVGHLVGYAGLVLFWWRALAAHSASARRMRGLAFLLTVLYAVSDEYHQSFVPGRTATLADLFIDAAGAVLGLWLVYRRQEKWGSKVD